MSPTEPTRAFTLQEPEKFLRFLHDHPERLSLAGVTLTEMWSLAALAALARTRRALPLQIESPASPARSFATAVGFDDVVLGRRTSPEGEAGRTVRLTQVDEEESVNPVAFKIAHLLAGEQPARQSARLTLEYVMIELLRNVLQHSGDELGGVVGAQLNDRGLHEHRPVFQVAVADTGKGIPATLRRQYPEIEDDWVALERAMWPFVSGAFAPGRTGGLENAGLGLFYIAEMAKGVGGRLLIASQRAAVVVDPQLPQRQEFLRVGYPGTLVAFEIPAESSRDFGELFEAIGELARQRTPSRLTSGWLRYEPPPANTQTFLVQPFLENNEKAQALARDELIPRLVKKEPVALDFINVRVCTQSFAHALLYEALRFAWASQTPLYIANAAAVVRSALHHVETYAHRG